MLLFHNPKLHITSSHGELYFCKWNLNDSDDTQSNFIFDTCSVATSCCCCYSGLCQIPKFDVMLCDFKREQWSFCHMLSLLWSSRSWIKSPNIINLTTALVVISATLKHSTESLKGRSEPPGRISTQMHNKVGEWRMHRLQGKPYDLILLPVEKVSRIRLSVKGSNFSNHSLSLSYHLRPAP